MLCGFSSSAFASGGPNERCRRFGPHRNQELEEEDETWEGVEQADNADAKRESDSDPISCLYRQLKKKKKNRFFFFLKQKKKK